MPGVKAIQTRLGYGAHVMILFIGTFAVFLLSLLITFSSPFIKSIYFLSASRNTLFFGAFGFATPTTISDSRLGYEYGAQVLEPLTSAMVLWGILDVFLFFQLMGVIPLLWVHDSAALNAVANSTFFNVSSYASTTLITVAWPISIVGWSVARRSFALSVPDSAPQLGLMLIGWPADQSQVNGTGGGTTTTTGAGNDGRFYHYRQTTREVTRPRTASGY
ncbi:hypothetical protein QFC21_003988 [Naganishia friedmannii]|uniref:Uncharacterized protein n=1 Tax=Naganishia friedmannii TaxID=89922 RepID=A0ACC2VIX4_9TREE|nr:hypothetical protein QFC21_003988 [Naganishia friedmannii]